MGMVESNLNATVPLDRRLYLLSLLLQLTLTIIRVTLMPQFYGFIVFLSVAAVVVVDVNDDDRESP